MTNLSISTPKPATADDVVFIVDATGNTIATMILHGTASKQDQETDALRARLKAAAETFAKEA